MPKKRIIDEIDIKILKIIQVNPEIPNVRIARQLRMAPSAILERIRNLKKRGVIQRYEVRLDPDSLGKGLLAFLFIKTDEPMGETGVAKRIASIPEVQEVHVIAGEDCYLVKLRVGSSQDLGRLIRERFGRFKSIRSSRTTMVLQTFKETGTFPLTVSGKG